MYGNLRTTAISGNARPSFFGSAVQHSNGFHVGLGSSAMNLTPADWYHRAKEALAKYDDLKARITRIADEAERKTIQEWAGSPIVDGTPANQAQDVLTDVREVETFIPANVNAYQVPSRTKKIEDLEGVNRDLEAMIVNAEAIHGMRPGNQGATQPAPESPGWLVPTLVGVTAIGIAVIVTAVYGGKG